MMKTNYEIEYKKDTIERLSAEKLKVIKSWRRIPWFIIIIISFLVVAQTIEGILISYLSISNQKEITNNSYIEQWISIGLGVIAFAVTIWLGLNIYSIVTNKEIGEIERKISDLDKDIEIIKAFSSSQYQISIQELRNSINRFGTNYPLFRLFDERIVDEIDRIEDLPYKEELVGHILYLTNQMIEITNRYEQNNWYDSNSMAKLLYNKIEQMKDVFWKFEDERGFDFTRLYLRMIKADCLFYKNAGLLRDDNIQPRDFHVAEREMEIVVNIFQEAAECFGDEICNDFDDEMLANIYNSIGYSNELRLRLIEKCKDYSDSNIDKYLLKKMGEAYERVLSIDGNRISAKKISRYYHNIAIYYNRQEKYSEAIKVLSKGLQKDHSDYKGWNLMGQTLLKKSKEYNPEFVLKAEKCFIRAIEISNSFHEAYKNLNDLYIKVLEKTDYSDELRKEYIKKHDKVMFLQGIYDFNT